MTDHIATLYSDTLVFQLTEIDKTSADLRVYVVYDYERDTYCVFGRRTSISDKFKTFSFEFECICDVYEFIRLSVETRHHRFDYALYSLNNLPADISDFSFYLLENFTRRSREICAFDDEKFKKSKILDYMQVIATPIMEE